MSWTCLRRLAGVSCLGCPSGTEVAGELFVECGVFGAEPGDLLPVGVNLLLERFGAGALFGRQRPAAGGGQGAEAVELLA